MFDLDSEERCILCLRSLTFQVLSYCYFVYIEAMFENYTKALEPGCHSRLA